MASPVLQRKAHIPALTGIRGVAAITVMVSHIAIWLNHPVVPGQWAVDLFFVLSGFVLSFTYLKDDGPVNWRKFFTARFARIYPLHIVTAAILGGILTWHVVRGGHPDASVNVLHFVREMSLTTAMPMVGDGLMWNDPSWSISVEAWVYVIAFPIIALVGYRIAPKAAAVGLLIILAVFGGWLMAMDSGDWEKVGWIAFGRAVVEFSAGWAAYRLFGKLTVPARLTDALAILLPIVLVAVRMMSGKEAWFLMPLFPVFVLGLTNAKSIASRLMSTRLMVWLGDISYSIYLLHTVLKFLLTPIAVKLHLEHSPIFWIPFAFAVIGASWATYVAFETPARRLISQVLDPKDGPEPAAARATF